MLLIFDLRAVSVPSCFPYNTLLNIENFCTANINHSIKYRDMTKKIQDKLILKGKGYFRYQTFYCAVSAKQKKKIVIENTPKSVLCENLLKQKKRKILRKRDGQNNNKSFGSADSVLLKTNSTNRNIDPPPSAQKVKNLKEVFSLTE